MPVQRKKAITIIEELTASPEMNKTYLGKVQRITDFGAFVEILPGIDGLLHVSEIAHYRVSAVTDELQEGDQVLVKVINVDPSGKVRLSRKALLPVPDDAPTPHRDDNKPGASESGRGPGGGPPRHRSQSRNRSNREAVKR
jgi:polyribonucleotide nucleotidyltransferase